MKKRLLSLLCVFTIFITQISSACAVKSEREYPSFSDVSKSDPYYAAVTALASAGVLTGFADGTFQPQEEMSREQFAAVLVRALTGRDWLGDVSQQRFPDVSSDRWSAIYIEKAHEYGLINGFEDGTFRPESHVTCGQAVTMIVRMLDGEEQAQQLGGYPQGYWSVGQTWNMFNGVNPSIKENAKRYVVAMLICNALESQKGNSSLGNVSTGNTGSASNGTGSSGTQPLKSKKISSPPVTVDGRGSSTPLSVEQLCSSVWVNNGFRNSDTRVYIFSPDGTITVYSPGNTVQGSGSYQLQNNILTLNTTDINGYTTNIEYSYCVKKNILVDISGERYVMVEQDHSDSNGSYVEAKTTKHILEPYSQNPFESEGGMVQYRQSIAPTPFSSANIKETVRPYLQALSYILLPPMAVEYDLNDKLTVPNIGEHYRITNYQNWAELYNELQPYVTQEYMNKYLSPEVPSESIIDDERGFYMYDPSAVGFPHWDANSATFYGLIGDDEIAVLVDEYNSADVYNETRMIYFKEQDGKYVVSGINHSNQGKSGTSDSVDLVY